MLWSAVVLCGLVCGEIEIDAKYPGGNIVVDSIDKEVVRLQTDLRDTAGWWFYWNFRIRGAQGSCCIRVRPPADRPAWTGREHRCRRHLAARPPEQRHSLLHLPLFTPRARGAAFAHLRFLISRPTGSGSWRRTAVDRCSPPCSASRGTGAMWSACTSAGPVVPQESWSRNGRSGGRRAATMPVKASANYVLEGLIAAVLEPETEETRWLAAHRGFPRGAVRRQGRGRGGRPGKNRRPRDHNRDYVGESIYPETKAIRQQVPQWLAGGPRRGHRSAQPCIRGDYDTWIYQVGSSVDRIAPGATAVRRDLATAARGTLPYRKTSFPFGKAWNKAGNYQAGMAFDRWAAEREEMRLATSFEIPYAQASRVEVNPTSARAFGRDIATALAVYIRTFATATVGSRPKGTR